MSEIRIKCEICGELIALADTDTLRRPMMGDLFKSPDAWHGVPDPFEPSLDWEAMRCPYGRQHRPFITEDHVMLESGEMLMVEYPEPPKPIPDYNSDVEYGGVFAKLPEVVTCSICGKKAKSNAGLSAHMRSHNG